MSPPEHSDETTVKGRPSDGAGETGARQALVVTLVSHPDAARIGSRLIVGRGDGVTVTRHAPAFAEPRGAAQHPLEDPQVSRRGLTVELDASGAATLRLRGGDVSVDGVPLADAAHIAPELIDAGVIVELGDRVALFLSTAERELLEAPSPQLGFVGESAAMQQVRRQIERIAPHAVPVLIRGESGAGKELVAGAIHRLGPRAAQPFVSVNLGAIPATMAPAALFGHVKGAFTGAVQASDGFFRAADGGTLFLDEVGAASAELQSALLRVLETREVQPLGTARASRVDVRLIAATDADLDREVDEGRLRLPLVMRLAGYELRVPPLRERRDDIPRLFVHFLREQLALLGRSARLATPSAGQAPWLPQWLSLATLKHGWPGNVRQLRNVAGQIAIDHADAPSVTPTASLRELLAGVATLPNQAAPSRERRSLDAIDDDQVLEALRRHDFQPGRAARELGLSRTSLYALIARSGRLKKASDLGRDEIRAALESAGGDTRAAASALAVSSRGLRLRMRALGME